MNKIRVSIYGILIDNGKVLLVRTKLKNSSIINFPGGEINWDENPEDCLMREFFEETSLKAKINSLLFASKKKHFFPDFPQNHCYCIYYEVTVKDLKINLELDGGEIQDCFWYPISKLPHLEMGNPELEFCNFIKTYFMNFIS